MMKRRKERTRQTAARTIRVESDMVYVVPFAVSRSYFRTEIASEGFRRTGCTPIILFPRSEAGEATSDWCEMIFSAMDEARRSGEKEGLDLAGLSRGDANIDVGLLDIPISFRGPPQCLVSNLARRSAEFLGENLRHLDRLLRGTFTDQMTLVTVFHEFRSDGNLEFHQHNVIFGVRREFRGGETLIGPLDLRPVIESLERRLRVAIAV